MDIVKICLSVIFIIFSCIFIILQLVQEYLRKRNKQKDLSVYIGISALIALVGGVPIAFLESYDLHENGVLTNGEITSIGVNIEYSYVVSGVKYKWFQSETGYHTLEEGEIFKVLYHPEHPSDSEILISQPVLIGQFEEVYLQKFVWVDGSIVRFSYEVLGKKYERIYIFPDEVKIDENKKYLVKYRVDNPQIAYIFLDKWKE